jgi:hypothetical protein
MLCIYILCHRRFYNAEFLETCILLSLDHILYVAILIVFCFNSCFCLLVDAVSSNVITRCWSWCVNVLSFVTVQEILTWHLLQGLLITLDET